MPHLTKLHKNALMLTWSVTHFKGLTSVELQKAVDWLNNTSTYGIDLFAFEAEKRGYMRSKHNEKKGALVYFATREGKRAYKKHFPD